MSHLLKVDSLDQTEFREVPEGLMPGDEITIEDPSGNTATAIVNGINRDRTFMVLGEDPRCSPRPHSGGRPPIDDKPSRKRAMAMILAGESDDEIVAEVWPEDDGPRIRQVIEDLRGQVE